MGSISSFSQRLILTRGGRFTPLTRGLFDDGIPNQPKPIGITEFSPRKTSGLPKSFWGFDQGQTKAAFPRSS